MKILLVMAFVYALYYFAMRFWPRKAKRDISRLAPTDDDTDADATAATEEVVEVDGGPLKPHHRRLALRDLRLLPKPKPKGPVWPRPPKRKVMDMDEATRLFAATLRTKDRK